MTEHDEITALRARVAELEAQWDEWEAAETNLAVAEARVAELEREVDERQRDAESMAYTAAMAINELRDVQNVSAILREMRARADAAEARVAELELLHSGQKHNLEVILREMNAAEARVVRLTEVLRHAEDLDSFDPREIAAFKRAARAALAEEGSND